MSVSTTFNFCYIDNGTGPAISLLVRRYVGILTLVQLLSHGECVVNNMNNKIFVWNPYFHDICKFAALKQKNEMKEQ